MTPLLSDSSLLTGCQTIDKFGRFCRPIKSANFLDIGHHGDCFQWEIKVNFIYSFCLLFYDVYFRSLDAEKK